MFEEELKLPFMGKVLAENLPIWDECIEQDFVQKLKKGTLEKSKFKNYMIQDSVYLKNYARMFGRAIYNAQTMAEIRMFYSVLNFANDVETQARLDFLKQYDIDEKAIEAATPLPANQAYIDYMMKQAKEGTNRHILMAILPCMLSYAYIFDKINQDPEKGETYQAFIDDYVEDEVGSDAKTWIAFAEKMCADSSEAEKQELAQIFKEGSYCELAFWQMDY